MVLLLPFTTAGASGGLGVSLSSSSLSSSSSSEVGVEMRGVSNKNCFLKRVKVNNKDECCIRCKYGSSESGGRHLQVAIIKGVGIGNVDANFVVPLSSTYEVTERGKVFQDDQRKNVDVV